MEEESNWRGTWVLEVKDMTAMEWGMVKVPKEGGRGGKWVHGPTRQLPFGEGGKKMVEGRQDDLIVMLGR